MIVVFFVRCAGDEGWSEGPRNGRKRPCPPAAFPQRTPERMTLPSFPVVLLTKLFVDVDRMDFLVLERSFVIIKFLRIRRAADPSFISPSSSLLPRSRYPALLIPTLVDPRRSSLSSSRPRCRCPVEGSNAVRQDLYCPCLLFLDRFGQSARSHISPLVSTNSAIVPKARRRTGP